VAYDLERANRADRQIVYDQPGVMGAPARLGKITTATASIGVGKFLKWHPVTVYGDETEGGTPTLEVITGVELTGVLVQGSASQNDIVLFRFADYNWATAGVGVCNWTFTIRGCRNLLRVGDTVNLRQSGVLIATGTTDGSGQVTLSVPAGTYDVEVVPTDARYATNTASRAHTCNQSTSITLLPTSDYACGGDCFNCELIPATVVGTQGADATGIEQMSGTYTWRGAPPQRPTLTAFRYWDLTLKTIGSQTYIFSITCGTPGVVVTAHPVGLGGGIGGDTPVYAGTPNAGSTCVPFHYEIPNTTAGHDPCTVDG
jgi:hypothetical protein